MSMRRTSLGRQLGRTLFTQQASIFAVRPIARTGCCELLQPLILAISAQTTRKVAFWNAFRSEIGCCASNV
jgi:hypothetical protein